MRLESPLSLGQDHVNTFHSGTRGPFLCNVKWALNRQDMFRWRVLSRWLNNCSLNAQHQRRPASRTQKEPHAWGLAPSGPSPARGLDAFRSQSGADLVASNGHTPWVVLSLPRPPHPRKAPTTKSHSVHKSVEPRLRNALCVF